MALLDKWHLKNQPIIDLDAIAQKCWEALTGLIEKLVTVIHYATMPETAVHVLWDDLPMKPFSETVDKKNFIKYYEQYLEIFGTRPAINTTQGHFQLDYFEVINLRYFPAADLYPQCCMRIRMQWDADKLTSISKYLEIVGPARTKFHKELLPPRTLGGFGKKPFGKTFGIWPDMSATYGPLSHPETIVGVLPGAEPGGPVTEEYVPVPVSTSVPFGTKFGVDF